MRFGGVHFLDDEAFLAAGEADARRLMEWCGLTKDRTVLDIGCGTGRLPIGILSTLKSIRSYYGVDVSEAAVDWCSRHITPDHPSCRFLRINAKNERYNPRGEDIGDAFRLPFPPASFDIIHLYSVFSHMRSKDIRAYLREFTQLLKPSGSIFLTAFVADGVPDEGENPPDMQKEWKGALHCVRFSRPFFTRLIADAGFTITRESLGTETDGQSAFLLRFP
jgi:ubiquinone/menaquinone biosynthesis C-methylase UbiE